jgi:hypothetical protein
MDISPDAAIQMVHDREIVLGITQSKSKISGPSRDRIVAKQDQIRCDIIVLERDSSRGGRIRTARGCTVQGLICCAQRAYIEA